jgi:hypothetical protein
MKISKYIKIVEIARKAKLFCAQENSQFSLGFNVPNGV